MRKKDNSETKYSKLIIETGSFIFIILSVLFFIMSNIVIGITSIMMKTSLRDNLYVNVLSAQNTINENFLRFKMDYLMDHKDILSKESLTEYLPDDGTMHYEGKYDEASYNREEYFDKLSEKEKKEIVLNTYQFNSLMLSYVIERNDRDSILVIDASDPDNLFVVFNLDRQPSLNDFYSITDIEKTSFWENSEAFELKDHPAIKKILNGSPEKYEIETFEVNKKSMTNLCLPLYRNGDLRYILCMTTKTEVVSKKGILKTLFKPLVFIFLATLLIAVLISIYIYRIITRPLSKITKSIQSYTKTKDSEEAAYQMSEIDSKNEIGVLADDFRNLTAEIDRYNNEHINLIKEKSKYESDLLIATKIQENMLIKDFPDDPRFRLYASMTPAKEVGGDLYDFFMLDEDHLCMTIADVSGKGIAAGLIMMAALTSIRNYTFLLKSPDLILEKANDEMCRKNPKSMFVTAWIGILDLSTGVLTTANAGHEYPAININGQFELFKDKHGFVLGGMSGMKYKTEVIQLKKGDSIFVYTDGVPEATDSEEKMFGTDKMIEALNISSDAEPEELLKNVKASVDEFVGNTPQFDDLTMLSIKYSG